MGQLKVCRVLSGVALITAFLACSTRAAVIDLSTPGNASDWLITAAGAVDEPSYQSNVNRPGTITLVDNALVNGVFVPGASLDDYNGYWHAENRFLVPDNATEVQLEFDGLWANDRVVLTLNGVDIGNATFGGGTGLGLMRFEEFGADLPYTFTETTAGTVTSGFNVGGTNVLRMTINNTGVNLAAPTVASAFPGDATVAHLANATVSYTVIPEPSSVAFLLAATSSLLLTRRRQRT